MIDDLKVLIDAIAGLPELAIWVLLGFLFYKLMVIGSIYSIIRLAIVKLHGVLAKDWIRVSDLSNVCLLEEDTQALKELLNEWIHSKNKSYRKYFMDKDDLRELRGLLFPQDEAEKTDGVRYN